MQVADIRALGERLKDFLGEFGDCFRSYRSRIHLRTYVTGQLSVMERKSVEPIADKAAVPPRTLQEFLGLHRWDENRARDRIQEIVIRDHVGEEIIGVIDETSFPKKGAETACVQRQYCGATGKIDNCVITVNLGVVVDGRFHTLVDSDPYLPESWHQDRERCRKAGIPDEVVYRKLHEIALAQIRGSLDRGVRLDWITADERYAEVPDFLQGLEDMKRRYVLEVPVGMTGWAVPPSLWKTREEAGIEGYGLQQFPRLASNVPDPRSIVHIARHSYAIRHQEWTPYRIKDTEKGPEVWQVKEIAFWQKRGDLPSPKLRLLVAWNVLDGTLKYFVSNAPESVPLETLLRIAFSRYHIERCFEDSKGEVGMDHFEVRSWRSIRRHMVISMISHLFLAREHARLRGEKSGPDHLPSQESDRLPDRFETLAATAAVASS